MADTSRVQNMDISLGVDEMYLALLNELDPSKPELSDENYASELQLQEVLMSSIMITTTSNITSSNTSAVTTTGIEFSVKKEETTRESKGKTVEMEVGEASSLLCNICMEAKPKCDMFPSNAIACTHVFCSDCVASHIASKIQDNFVVVACPEPSCSATFDLGSCRSIVPAQVIERWGSALCESMVEPTKRFYCPFADCSALLENDNGGGHENVVRQSECPNCRRLFCAQCKVAWHSSVDCEEFLRLNAGDKGKNDFMMLELAKGKGWKRCPKCQFFVEKTEGCLHITCRCGSQFCYRCGSSWSENHGDCIST